MKTTLVHIEVKPEHLDEFIEASKQNAAGTREEPGNIRFDVLQSADDPCRFVLYEIFADEAAVLAHKETPHYHAWRESVADWMAVPRKAAHYLQHNP